MTESTYRRLAPPPTNRIVAADQFDAQPFFLRILFGCILASVLASLEAILWKGDASFDSNTLVGIAFLVLGGLVLGGFAARALRLVLPDLTEGQMLRITLAWLWPNAAVAFHSLWILSGSREERSPASLLTLLGGIDSFLARTLLVLAGACAGGWYLAKALSPYIQLRPAMVCGFWLLGYCGAALIVRENLQFSSRHELFEHLFLENIPLYFLPGFVINLLIARSILHSAPRAPRKEEAPALASVGSCRHCNAPVNAEARVCPHCGQTDPCREPLPWESQAREEARSGNESHAVKIVRDHTGLGLTEATHLVKSWLR